MLAAAAIRSLFMFSSLDTPPDAAIRFFTFSEVSFALFLRQDLGRGKSDLILRSRASHGVSKDGCTAMTRGHPSRRPPRAAASSGGGPMKSLRVCAAVD